jgi:hypothetical protein
VVEEYFTDRATGEIHKLGLKTLLGPAVDSSLGNQFTAWRNAFQRGIINLQSAAPVANDDDSATAPGVPVQIDLLQNDSDPDGDALLIDGIVQPRHGQVVDNGDGSVTYQPDFDFSGVDRFRYWATDDHGNYNPADVTVTVIANLLFRDGFEP